MDSPIRQQLKRNDYQRHKLFRKIARRRKAKKEQELKAAEKELKRKLRIPKYTDGKSAYTYIKPLDGVGVDEEGNLRDPEVPSAKGTVLLPEVTVNIPDWKDTVGRYSIASNDALRVTGLRLQNTHLNKQAEEGAARHAAWAKENPGLETAGLIAGAAPFTVAAYPALAGTGELAYPILTNPYVDKGIASAFAGHGLNHWLNEGIDGWGDAAMTALELVPLGGLAKSMLDAAKLKRNFIPTPESNMSGIIYAYNRNPELASIGTLEDYIDYLKTVFPESKVKDINYHMGPKGLLELKPSTGKVWNTNPKARGIYVTPDKSYAQAIRKYTTSRLENPSIFTNIKRNLIPGGWDKANDVFTDIYPVIIDTKNPLLTKGTWTWGIGDKKYQSLMEDYDAIVNSGPKWYQNANSMPETIVPKTKQSLILGSDADVAGFRRFMSNPQMTAHYEDGKPTDTTWMSNWLTKRADKILENMGDIPSETFDRFNTATAQQQLLNLLGTVQKTVQEVENKAGVGKFNGRTDIKSNPRTITIAADAPAQTVVHELTHALASPAFGGMEDSLPQHQKISLIYKEDGVHSVAPTTTKDGRVIPPDIRAQLEKYINSPEEIYGRLNELRYGLGLNPTYIVTPEDVLKWRAAGKFDRFWRDVPDSTILRLFNEVALQAVPIRDDGVYVAKDGKGAYGGMKRLKQPRYADGKPKYNIRTNDGTTHNFSFDEQGNTVLDDGSVGNLLLDNVTVRPQRYSSAFDGNLEYLDDLIGLVPVAGDLNDGLNAGIAAYNGDYLLAGMLGAGLLLPNILEKPLKYTLKFGSKGLLKLGSKLGVADYVWNDLATEGWKKIWDAKRNGHYAFTTKGHDNLAHKLYTDRIGSRIDDIIDKSLQLEKEQFNKRMYGKYADRFENAPNSLKIADKDNIGEALFDVLTESAAKASINDQIKPWMVLGDPRVIRKTADFRKDVEPISVKFDPSIQTSELYYGAKYKPKDMSIIVPMHVRSNSGFINPWFTKPTQYTDYLLAHEYTHHLLHSPDFALNLALSIYPYGWTSYASAMPNEYVFGQYKNPFLAIYDRSNNRLNEAMMSEKAGRGRLVDPDLVKSDYGKYGEHNASPNEAVADLRGRIVAGFSDEDIYDHMFREYGMSADDVDLAREMGYKYGKASGIHIKPENRGKFTALKKRTGKSASWFKAHGTPALKKMATFALNARKWKHKYEYGKALGDPPSGRRPLTFLGSVAKNITGSDNAALWTDGASGVLGFIPGVGAVITALDLGHDVNDLVHGDGATWSDVAWDVAGAIPFLKKGRKALKMLKKEKQLATSNRLLKKIDNQIKLWQDKKRTEDVINYGLWTPKLVDAVSDAK